MTAGSPSAPRTGPGTGPPWWWSRGGGASRREGEGCMQGDRRPAREACGARSAAHQVAQNSSTNTLRFPPVAPAPIGRGSPFRKDKPDSCGQAVPTLIVMVEMHSCMCCARQLWHSRRDHGCPAQHAQHRWRLLRWVTATCLQSFRCIVPPPSRDCGAQPTCSAGPASAARSVRVQRPGGCWHSCVWGEWARSGARRGPRRG